MAKRICLDAPVSMKFNLLLLVLFFSIFQVIKTQESQQLTREEFNSELRKAFTQNNEQQAFTLIQSHRLFVKPFIDGLIREVIIYELKGRTKESERFRSVASGAAAGFEKIFGEKSLSIAVNYLTIWSKEQKASKLVADSLYSEGTRYRLGNEPEKAISTLEDALGLYRTIKDERGEAEVLGGLGAFYYNNIQDFQKALDYYNEALLKREIVDDKVLIGNTTNSLGSVYNKYVKDYPASIKYYERTEAIRKEIGDSSGLITTQLYKADALRNYGEELNNMGMYDDALSILEMANDINGRIGAEFERGETLSLMGFVYSKLGDYNTAAEKLTEAVKIMQEVKDTLGLAGVYNHFGIVLQWAGRSEKALEYYNNALKIYEEQNSLIDEIPVIGNLGTLFFQLKEYAKAEEYHIRGLELCREVNDQEKEIDNLLNLANDQIFLNKQDEALLNYREGLRKARIINNPDLVWRLTAGMAECYEIMGENEKVVELNDSALNLLDSLRNTLQSEELKTSIMARERYVFEDMIDMLATLHEKDGSKGYDKVAFSYAERSKSRVLLDLLSGYSSAAFNKTSSNFEIARNQQPVSLNEAQSLCPDGNTVILEYSVGDTSSCLWVITSTAHRLFKIPDRKTLQEQIETIRFVLLDPSMGVSEFFTRAGISLYNELIKPAEPFLSKKSRLVIIPDGVLNYLPFEILLYEDKKQASDDSFSNLPFLVKKYPVSYVQSASVLSTLIMQSRKGAGNKMETRSFLAFGDPVYEDASANSQFKFSRLEYSGNEIENIAAFFNKGPSEIYLRNDATEEKFKQNEKLNKFNYIHFATHGLINEEKPDLSSLVLTGINNSGEDGFLQASEIFDLKLNADLVVLSACQTGLGKLIRGEGMVGLTRAFLYAGTSSVLVSLWSVSDISTATLMGEFYKNLIKNKLSKTDALHNAQLTLMSDEKFAHPFYWAPFVLIGDWR